MWKKIFQSVVLFGSAALTGAAEAIEVNVEGENTETQSAVITDSLLKTGTGTYILNQNNTYTGGTVIQAGTLQMGDGTTAGLTYLGTGGTVTIRNGATLTMNTAAANTIVLFSGKTFKVEDGGKISVSKGDLRLAGSSITLDSGSSVSLLHFSAGRGGAGSALTLNGGTLNVTGSFFIGNDGETGTWTINSGTQTLATATVGQYEGTGSYFQKGGTTSATKFVTGNSGTNAVGFSYFSSGSLTTTDFQVGLGRENPTESLKNSVGTGTVEISGDAVLTVTGTASIGTTGISNAAITSSGFAYVSQSGGSFTTPNLKLGTTLNLQTGKTSLYDLSGGTLAVTKLTDSDGLFHMTDGTLIFQKNGSTAPTISNDLTVSGGTVQIGKNASELTTLTAAGDFTQTGGTIVLDLTLDGNGVLTASDRIFADKFTVSDTELLLNAEGIALGTTVTFSSLFEDTNVADVSDFDFSSILTWNSNGPWGWTLADGVLTVTADANMLPEPVAWLLLLLGVFGLWGSRRRIGMGST